ncbi:MarR family winged helix-turn-helix transcriptional regulator [Thalassotalea sp. PP2-459]|uniref:MarR family winged helix-turn-helix transcriptional regulator n=1 Tax=Thalassotalea sp. PP2-459 TaxID=1742724 RepID=UPI000942E513|nr:MarR family transcriptional regulator [Thalassotalea sp. PP2-459]OKY27484.1 transcriptional regulator [Thalassotalea sp. PP2-459]
MLNEAKEHLVFELIGLQNSMLKKFTGTLSIHGLGLSDYLVLDKLYHAPHCKIRRSDLAEQVGLTPSGVTRLLNPLEKIGLVTKEANARDARVSLVALSPIGEQVYQEAKASFSQAISSLFESLKPVEINSLVQLLKKI